MSEAPRTPIRHLKPGGDEENLRRTPGGVSMDIVLTPALKAPPTNRSVTSSPLTPRDINQKLSNAEARRDELRKLRTNIDDKLATVQTKKEEMIIEKTNKVRENLENKLKSSEENRDAIIRKTKEDVHAYLTKVEKKVSELEVSTEAEKIAFKIAMDAHNIKVDDKRLEQLETRVKELQDHEDYVKMVKANQEKKKQQYLAELELSLEKASRRKEDHLAKVVESVKVEDVKIAEAKERREREEKELQEKARMSLREKLLRAEEKQASKNEDMKVKIEENLRKAEAVKQNKTNLVPESA